MKIKKYLKIFLILVTAGLFLQSCATILEGKKNTLIFTGENATKAEVYIDDELVGEAPGKIKIAKEKIQHGSILVIKADGFEEKEYMLLRKQNATYTVVDLLLGGIPLVVDYTTGNIYRPNPRKFEYELVKQE
jgi:hypothetical protein